MKIDELDAIGLLCPLPVLKLRKRLSGVQAGDHIRLLADDPAAMIDVPHFCAETGHVLVESTQSDGVQSYLVRKKT